MAELRTYRPEELAPWPGLNPRRAHGRRQHEELKDSIAAQGIRQAVAVHDLTAPHPEHGEALAAKRELAIASGIVAWVVAGERRLRAATEVGAEIPAMVGTYSEAEALDVALIENLQRADMNPLDEARGFQRRLELGDITQAQLAAKIGLDASTIANRIRLLAMSDELLALVETGVLLPSHARDYILPFASIPARKWAKLCTGVAKSLRAKMDGLFGGEGVRAEDVRRAVGGVAERLSNSLTPQSYSGGAGAKFDPVIHESCACNGPVFEYGWHGKVRRCFDDTWWKAQQQEAEDAVVQARAKDEARAKTIATAAGERPLLTPTQVHVRYGYDTSEIGSEKDGFFGSVYDLALIPPDALAFVEKDGLTLICTDRKKSDAARSAVKKERDALVAERRKKAAEEDLAAARAAKFDVSMLRALISDALDDEAFFGFSRMLEGLGYVVDAYGHDEEELLDVAKVADDEIVTWVKLYALRAARGESAPTYGDDPIEKAVDKELKKKYSPALRALFRAAEGAPSKNGKKPKAKKAKGGRQLATADA